jgi:hypothetical protein
MSSPFQPIHGPTGVTLYENVDFGGRQATFSNTQPPSSFHQFAANSIKIHNIPKNWVIFCSEDAGNAVLGKGSLLAVWGGVHGLHGAFAGANIKDLSQVTKVNSFPLGLGNGNWSGEIHSFIYADGPPTIGVTKADGITIIDQNGSVTSGAGS